MNQIKFYVVSFVAGLLLGGFITCKRVEIKKEEVNAKGKIQEVVIQPNGETHLHNVSLDVNKVLLDKKISPFIGGGFYVGGGYDILLKKENAALGLNLGGVLATGEVTTDLSSIRLNLLFNL